MCCDLSSFSPQLNYHSVEGWHKRALGCCFLFLTWVAMSSSQDGVISCAINYISFYTRGSVWGILLLGLCGCWCYGGWQKTCICRRTRSPAGCSCMGCCVNLSWGQAACWEECQLVWPALLRHWELHLLTYLLAYLTPVLLSLIFYTWELLCCGTKKK